MSILHPDSMKSYRKFSSAVAVSFAFILASASAHGQASVPTKSYEQPSQLRPASPTPDPNIPDENAGKKKTPAEAEADAREAARFKREKMVIAPAPSKKSTPSPEFAGSLLDAGLPKISGEKESAKSKRTSNSQTVNADGTQQAVPAARPKETPSPHSTAAKIEAPSLSLVSTPTPSASASLPP